MAWFPCHKSGGGGNSKDSIVTFNPAEKRENISSGEKHKTIFGKIAKYFSDLKPVAFTGSYNDLRDKPLNLAPAAHRHSKSDITDFPSSMPASDVYGWAKAASKPTYTAGEVGAVSKTGDNISGDYYYNYNNGSGMRMSPASGGDKEGGYFRLYLWHTTNITTGGGFTYDIYADPYAQHDFSPTPTGTLGRKSKWNQIYAVNSSISTSDRNEKEEISYIGSKSSYEDTSMTDEELTMLVMGMQPVIFKRINGESGRPHHGIIAQEFEELMAEIGLHDHAAFIKSPVTKTKEVETKDKDGNIKHQLVEETVSGEYRYGIRYEEFISDLIRFCQLLKDENSRQQKKIEDLEKRIKILEDIIKQGA